MNIDEIKEAWNKIIKSYNKNLSIEEYNEIYEYCEDEENDHDCQFD